MTIVLLAGSKQRPVRFIDDEGRGDGRGRLVGLLPHAAKRLKQRQVSLEDVAAALRSHDPEHYRHEQVRARFRDVRVVAVRAGDGGWTVITVFKGAVGP